MFKCKKNAIRILLVSPLQILLNYEVSIYKGVSLFMTIWINMHIHFYEIKFTKNVNTQVW